LFSFYAANFGNFNATYGSLGAVIGFMTWMWISAITVLIGAELNAEMEHQTARDTTTGHGLVRRDAGRRILPGNEEGLLADMGIVAASHLAMLLAFANGAGLQQN
jgi:hypothetical protein